MGESGLKVGVINVPMTYPPEPVNGYMISGLDSPGGSKAVTFPEALFHEIESVFGDVNPQIRYLGYLKSAERRTALLHSLDEMSDHYCRVTEYLLRKHPVDVAMVVFTATDTAQHFFWHYMDESHPHHDAGGANRYGEAILKVYRKIDQVISRLTRALPEESSVILMSDHGFCPTSARVVYLNRYLCSLGLLKIASRPLSRFHPRALLDTGIRKADSLLRTRLTPRQKEAVARWMPGVRNKWEAHYSGMAQIDWQHTKAYSYEGLTFPPSIWINVQGARPEGIVDPGTEYEEVMRFLISKLSGLMDPVTGKQLIRKVYRKEEIYHGPYLDHAPDLTLSCWDEKPFLSKPSFNGNGDGEVVEYLGGRELSSGEWTGTHSLNGMVVLKGGAFAEGGRLQTAAIIDLAPTLLYLLGLPVPQDMDGRVLIEAFDPEFSAAHELIIQQTDEGEQQEHKSMTYTAEDAMQVTERLRQLGYVE